jgi:hypothetical protein
VVASRPATLARRRPRSPSSARFRYSPSTACRNSSVACCAGSGVRATRVVNFEPRPACAIGRNTAGCGCVPRFRHEELVVALALTGSYVSWFSTNVNTVVFAPMARASVRIATPVKGGERRNMRMAHRRSRAMSLWNASHARFRHSSWWMAIGHQPERRRDAIHSPSSPPGCCFLSPAPSGRGAHLRVPSRPDDA